MRTKKISVREATPDMVLAEGVYAYSGQNILPKWSVLTNRSITRLKFYSISEIVIQLPEEEYDDVREAAATDEPSDEICQFAQENKERLKYHRQVEDTYAQIIRDTPEYARFNADVIESAKVLRDSISGFITRAGEDLDTNLLLNQTKEIIIMNKNPMNTFRMLQNIRKYDDATFIHCLNVAIICNVFGHWIRMPKEDIDILTLAGLLHDIGKMAIPERIIKKPSILTDSEYNIVKQHPKRGYHLLEPLHMDERIKRVVLQHHERCDGSGYPYGLKGNQIDEFSKIVAVADIYDAMTSARVYRGPICPFEVISVIQAEGYDKFEAKYMIPFLEGIVNAYLNANVILSDGRVGVIVLNNKNSLSRPVVRVGDELIDLSQQEDLRILNIA